VRRWAGLFVTLHNYLSHECLWDVKRLAAVAARLPSARLVESCQRMGPY